jgi:CHAT domain-containing protein
MSNTFRAALSLLILNLSLITPAVTQPVADDSVRALTEQYGRAIVAGDLEAMRKFWNPQSPNLNSQFRYYKSILAQARLQFINPQLTRVEVNGDKAVTELTTDERRFDKKTGAVLLTWDPFYGASRSFEWTRTGSGWRIEREFLVQDELADKLFNATSDREREEIFQKEKRYVNNTLVNALGTKFMRHQMRAEYDVALRYIELQGQVAERIGDQTGIAGSSLNRAILKHAQDDHEPGLAPAYKALALYQAAGNQRGVALAQETLANLYRALGDHRRAFEFAQKSLRLSEETKHRRGMMAAFSELAIIYGQQNNAEQALAHLEKAFAIAQELEDTIMIATLRHDIALQYKKFGDYDRSLAMYQQLLQQVESFGDQSGAAMVRDQIGRIFTERKKYDEALSYHRKALAQLDADKTKRATVVTLNNISGVYLLQAKYAEALSAAEQAASLSRETGRQNDLCVALINLGYAQLGLNRIGDAGSSFTEAVAIMERLRTLAAGGVEERQRYFEGGVQAHHGLLNVLVKENRLQDALFLAERAKARALLDMMQQGRAGVQKQMTAQEQEEERRLKSELIKLNKQLARVTYSHKQDPDRTRTIETQLEKARLDYEAFQNKLYAAHPELKTQRGEAPIVNAQELAELLPDASSVLLEYVVTDDKTYLFAITKAPDKAEAQIRVYTLPIARAELAKQIESFRQQLATRDLGFRAAAVKLYDLLLKPAGNQLRGKTKLVIAPDSNLWDLPFQALVKDSGRFLLEDASIGYAPSLTVLREMTRRRMDQAATRAPATLLALGNPVVRDDSVQRAHRTVRRLTPLPEAAEEVRALGRLYGASRSKIYVGAEAREDRVKNEAGRAGILHFTTHGTLNNASPMYSHLTLAGGGPNEDGLLEAWEFMQLDLKAELAVLSACETARGRIGAGEGMIGFSWAMFIAGVPSIVVSQWKVESASTRDLMVNFHRALTKETKSDALRQAALKLMRNPETSHPFYWAGFVLVGDGG